MSGSVSRSLRIVAVTGARSTSCRSAHEEEPVSVQLPAASRVATMPASALGSGQ
jgi:hypothetical protein